MPTNIRVFHSLDLNDIKTHLLVIGDISALCENCQKFDLTMESPVCPACKTEFKFAAFRSPKIPMAKVSKLMRERPSMKIIDYDDYHHARGSSKFDNLFKEKA